MPPRYGLELFRPLNDEYRTKRIVPSPRTMTPDQMAEQARARVRRLHAQLGSLEGARVLEVGCAGGALCRVLAEEFDCEVTGIDPVHYATWDDAGPRVRFVQGDASGDISSLGRFDYIYSFSVWEHIVHPYTALVNARDLLEPSGTMFLQAQLYCGPKASHRYREVSSRAAPAVHR